MKVFITKHALTLGVVEIEAEIIHLQNYTLCKGNYNGFKNCFLKGDFHFTKEAAIKKAEEMRLKKIASLEKQLVKYKNKRFK